MILFLYDLKFDTPNKSSIQCSDVVMKKIESIDVHLQRVESKKNQTANQSLWRSRC